MDIRLLQNIGNIASRAVQAKYPAVDIRFFALKEGEEGRIHLSLKGDKSGRTGRLYDVHIAPTQPTDALFLKEIAVPLENQIETHVLDFLKTNREVSS
jgi:hypothetical protein